MSRAPGAASAGDASVFKLKAQARRVNRFQQSRPSLAIDFDRESNDPFCQFVIFEHGNILGGPQRPSFLLRVKGEGRVNGLAAAP